MILQSRIWKDRPVLLDLLNQVIFRGKVAKRVCHPTHSISGKVELMDQWSINLYFNFLNLGDFPSLFPCPCLVLLVYFLCPLVSFKILSVYADPCKERQSSNPRGEYFNSNCLEVLVKSKISPEYLLIV